MSVKNEISFEDDHDMDIGELEKSLVAATNEVETSLIKKSPVKKSPIKTVTKVETHNDDSIVGATPENKKHPKPKSKKTTDNTQEDGQCNFIFNNIIIFFHFHHLTLQMYKTILIDMNESDKPL